MAVILLFLTLAISLSGIKSADEHEEMQATSNRWKGNDPSRQDICIPRPLGGIEWILSVRQPDYGWKEDTHRAVIALAINRWAHLTPEEIRQMELQLEVEITKALLRYKASTIYPNDLALYIHALIATNRNPHNFYGIDLVARLTEIVDSSSHQVHPFLLLALCNANRFSERHLHIAINLLQSLKSSKNTEYLALALKACECAKTLKLQVDGKLIAEVRNILIGLQQPDGSFGNVYTTSLVVQALASSKWNKRSAIEYLTSHSTVDVNMVSTCFIQLALNAENIPFIKSLYPDLKLGPAITKNFDDHHFVQYTVKVGNRPDVYFTITIKVAPNTTFFDVMRLSAQQDSKFKFSHYIDKSNKPNIYSVSGVPNDAEENLYWRLCLQTDVDHDRHVYEMKTIHDSPLTLVPKRDVHILYWYRDSDCEMSS